MNRRRALLAVGLAVSVVALVVLLAADSRPTPPLPKARAVPSARADRGVATFLRRNPPSRVTVIALDSKHWRVTFWQGQSELLDAAVDPHGRVDATQEHPPGSRPPGAHLMQLAPLVLLFALLFIAAVATRPLMSMRNLDAVVIAAAFCAAASLIDSRAVAPRVWAGAFGLAYVALRCGARTFGAEPEERPVNALIRDARVLAYLALGAVLAGVTIVVTSTGASDVAFAGLAGGTLLNHGTSPYGHLPTDVVHGDTYPPLTYVLYMPAAALSPVRDGFDSLDSALWLNALALLATAALLWRSRGGLRWALAWLAFPPILLTASGGGNDLFAAFFATAALLVLARPVLAATLFALAGWVKVGPAAALVPLLASLRGRELARAAGAVVAVLLVGFAFLAVLGSVTAAVDGIRFQFNRGSWFSVWQQLGTHGLQLGFEAVAVGVIAAAAVAVARAPSPRRIAAAAGLTIALLQLGANDWTSADLAWLVPFILVALFPPQRRRSPTPAPDAA